MSRFPSRGSRDQGLSLEAFPRGFPTGLSHVPPWCESKLGLKVEAVQGKQVSLEWTETSEDSGNVARPWSSSHLSCGECLLLRCDGNAGNSFPNTQGKDPSSRARSWKRGSSGCGRDSRASSRVETGMSCNLLRCSKGVKDPLEVPEVRSDSLETPQHEWAHLAWRREPPAFSRVGAGALDLRRGPQEPALVASGKASAHASCSGASRDSSPVDAGA